jgi:hypothetical protein
MESSVEFNVVDILGGDVSTETSQLWLGLANPELSTARRVMFEPVELRSGEILEDAVDQED